MITKKMMEHLVKEVSAGLGALEGKPEVKKILFANGYSEEVLRSIRTMCDEAMEFYTEKEDKDNAKAALYHRIIKKRKVLREHYTLSAQSIRDALAGDKSVLVALGVDGGTPRREIRFQVHVRKCYQSVLEHEQLERLAGYGVNKVRLHQGLDLLAELEKEEEEYLTLKGEKEYTTAARDRIFKELRRKWSAFKRNCRNLFIDDPHLLGGVIPVPAEGFKSRRGKKARAAETTEADE